MALVLIQMKLTILRHTVRGERVDWFVTVATLGLALAIGTVVATVLRPELLPALLAVWMLGWIFLPLFSGGGNETLRPEFFSMLPVPPRRLAAGLLAASFAGIAPLVSLIAFAALIVYAARLGLGPALIAVPATVLALATAVLLSGLAVALFGLLLRSRAGAVLAGFVTASVLVLAAQGWWLAVAFSVAGDLSWAETLQRALPSGWGVVAVEAAERSDWLVVVAMLVLSCALIGVLLVSWASLIGRRITNPRGNALAPATGRHRPMGTWGGRRGAVVAKELRAWSRDPMRINLLSFALFYGLLYCLLPVTAGWTGMLPYASAIAVTMAAASSANLYGVDGTALWLTLMAPGGERDDVRGRQAAWLLAVAPVAILLTVVAIALSGQREAWPWVLTLLPALLGGGAGLVVLLSVVALIPGIDPQKRGGNPLSFGDNDGAQAGSAFLMLVLVPLTALPALAVVLAGTLLDRPLVTWAGVPAGVVTGVLSAWLLGSIAHRRLRTRGPELLALMRHGPAPARSGAAASGWNLPKMPLAQTIVVYLCWGLAWLPLFPQGVVPLVFKLIGPPTRSWFLALYLPPTWQWPVIFFMIALGLAMYIAAFVIPRRYARADAEPRRVPDATLHG